VKGQFETLGETLTRYERLRRQNDFTNLFKNGKRIKLPGLTIIYVSNGLTWYRMAIGIGRKFGKAVQRNRAKRQLREFFRRNKKMFHELLSSLQGDAYSCCDIIFLPYKDFFHPSSFVLQHYVTKQDRWIGLRYGLVSCVLPCVRGDLRLKSIMF